MSLLIQLFLEFFKIGLFAVGGGLATIPFLHQLAEKYTWFTVETLVDMIAISESTPGAMGVNMATYTGFTTAGIPGSLVATLGLVLPSIVIISSDLYAPRFGEFFYWPQPRPEDKLHIHFPSAISDPFAMRKSAQSKTRSLTAGNFSWIGFLKPERKQAQNKRTERVDQRRQLRNRAAQDRVCSSRAHGVKQAPGQRQDQIGPHE